MAKQQGKSPAGPPRASAELVHRFRLEVRFSDMDAMGHVNNVVYLTYMEQARIEWLRAAGFLQRHDAPGIVLARLACEFLAPAAYPATLEVLVFAAPPGRSSIPTWYEIRDAARSDVVYARGEGLLVWVDRTTGRSLTIPDDVRAKLPLTRT